MKKHRYNIAKEFALLRNFKIDISTPKHILAIRQGEGLLRRLVKKKKHGVIIERFSIAGYLGDAIDVYVYQPKERKPNTPFVLSFHGGGYVIGHALNNPLLYRYAHILGVPVYSVDYRLAPEYPFPYGLKDCFSALTHLTDHADEMGLDASRIILIGDSAGGGMAASVSQMARDKGIPICLQALIYPVLSNASDTPSMKAFTDTPVWDYLNNVHMWQYYLPGQNDNPPKYAVPALGKLEGLAPCYIETAEFDPLRDEGIDYAKALDKAGVSTQLEATQGTIHGFDRAPLKGTIVSAQMEIRLNAMAKALE